MTVAEYIAVARDILAAQGVAAATAEEAAAAVEELGAEVCNYQNQSCIDIEKAKRVLGWEPTPFADAMRDTVDWCAAATRLHPARACSQVAAAINLFAGTRRTFSPSRSCRRGRWQGGGARKGAPFVWCQRGCF